MSPTLTASSKTSTRDVGKAHALKEVVGDLIYSNRTLGIVPDLMLFLNRGFPPSTTIWCGSSELPYE
jgi:hypothetical protein